MTATPQCSTPQDSKLDGGRSRGRIRPKKATAAPIPIAQLRRHSPPGAKNQPSFSLSSVYRCAATATGKRVRACGEPGTHLWATGRWWSPWAWRRWTPAGSAWARCRCRPAAGTWSRTAPGRRTSPGTDQMLCCRGPKHLPACLPRIGLRTIKAV